MRKKYVKPIIEMENFNFSQSIAACYMKLNLNRGEECETIPGDSGFSYDEVGGFLATNSQCYHEPEEYCYTNALDVYSTHIS